MNSIASPIIRVMETLDKMQLGVEQAEVDEIPELYDKRPDWPQASGSQPATTQFPDSVLHPVRQMALSLYSAPPVPSTAFSGTGWASTFCGLVETMMHSQSWQEKHAFAARPEPGLLEGSYHHHKHAFRCPHGFS